MGLFVRGQRCDLIDIARSISVAIAFYGGGREGRNYDFDKRLTDGFEDLNEGINYGTLSRFCLRRIAISKVSKLSQTSESSLEEI